MFGTSDAIDFDVMLIDAAAARKDAVSRKERSRHHSSHGMQACRQPHQQWLAYGRMWLHRRRAPPRQDVSRAYESWRRSAEGQVK